MGRVASSADNAAMESFLSLLQKNVMNRRRWKTRDQLRLAMGTRDDGGLSWPPCERHRGAFGVRDVDWLGQLSGC